MLNNVKMLAKDCINAKLAECFVTIEGNRYLFMQVKKIEAKFEKKKSSFGIVGKTGAGHKTTGWEGTGSATIWYGSPIFKQLLKRFKETGEDIYFDMQITNDDPNSAAGRQTIILKDCNTDGGILASFDGDSDDPLEEDIDFTFEDFEMPEEFKLLLGMV